MLDLALSKPRDERMLRDLTPNATAVNALRAGLYVAAGVLGPDQVADNLRFAASAGDGGHAATVAGALLGAMRGPACFPVGWVARLDPAWVGDTLARDYVQQLSEGPSGAEDTSAPGSSWWDRYPGG